MDSVFDFIFLMVFHVCVHGYFHINKKMLRKEKEDHLSSYGLVDTDFSNALIRKIDMVITFSLDLLLV